MHCLLLLLKINCYYLFKVFTFPLRHNATGVSAGMSNNFTASGSTEMFLQSPLGQAPSPVVSAKPRESNQGPTQSMPKYCLNEISMSLGNIFWITEQILVEQNKNQCKTNSKNGIFLITIYAKVLGVLYTIAKQSQLLAGNRASSSQRKKARVVGHLTIVDGV